ncbi:MAG: hypothetical protein K9N11_06540 [Lentisphaeria bacterium]|nr:hypothetical protein [Candidatus Neomarinimicrobiota bacterium]MCF7842492.1 hypothetical protein [Lentisphaeria bacterium]
MKERVGGILVDNNLMFIHLSSGIDSPDWAGTVLSKFAARNICIGFISATSSIGDEGQAMMSVTVKPDDEYNLDQAVQAVQELHQNLKVTKTYPVSLLTVYGPHFRERCGLAARAFRALGLNGVNILGISTSISSISSVVRQDQLEIARQALDTVFEVP